MFRSLSLSVFCLRATTGSSARNPGALPSMLQARSKQQHAATKTHNAHIAISENNLPQNPKQSKAKPPPVWIQARWTALCILHNPSMQATVPPNRNPTLESTASSAHATHPWPPHTQPTRNCTPEKAKACTKLELEHVEDGLPRSSSAGCSKWDTESKRCTYKGQHTKRKETKVRKKDRPRAERGSGKGQRGGGCISPYQTCHISRSGYH